MYINLIERMEKLFTGFKHITIAEVLHCRYFQLIKKLNLYQKTGKHKRNACFNRAL